MTFVGLEKDCSSYASSTLCSATDELTLSLEHPINYAQKPLPKVRELPRPRPVSYSLKTGPSPMLAYTPTHNVYNGLAAVR
jgi:hypothetical protein